jgi:hypothetical protein
VPQLYKGDNLKEQQRQETGNITAFNGVHEEIRDLGQVLDGRHSKVIEQEMARRLNSDLK